MDSTDTKNTQAANFMTFMQLLWPGPLVVQGICTAARLKIADLLADGPKSTRALAESASSQLKTLERLLRALSSVGLFKTDGRGNWQNTPLSELMREDHPQSMRAWALIMGAPLFWRPMGELHESIVSGTAAFGSVFQTSFFEYLKANPADRSLFNRAMAGQSSQFMGELAHVYDFSRFKSIADVGGGTGTLLANILRDNPALQGVLFELPDVIAEADSLVKEFNGRLTLERGSFLESVPAGLDCYMLVRVIHDWPDDECVAILRNCRKAMKPDSTLLLLEGILDAQSPPNQAMMDMLMLVLLGAMERTEEDFKTLLEKGGFEIINIIRKGFSILECRPAGGR